MLPELPVVVKDLPRSPLGWVPPNRRCRMRDGISLDCFAIPVNTCRLKTVSFGLEHHIRGAMAIGSGHHWATLSRPAGPLQHCVGGYELFWSFRSWWRFANCLRALGSCSLPHVHVVSVWNLKSSVCKILRLGKHGEEEGTFTTLAHPSLPLSSEQRWPKKNGLCMGIEKMVVFGNALYRFKMFFIVFFLIRLLSCLTARTFKSYYANKKNGFWRHVPVGQIPKVWWTGECRV